jgi:hypothetical protein
MLRVARTLRPLAPVILQTTRGQMMAAHSFIGEPIILSRVMILLMRQRMVTGILFPNLAPMVAIGEPPAGAKPWGF